MSYKKQLKEKLVSLSLDMRAIVDKAKAENARGLTSEEATTWDALEADYANIEASLTRAEKSEKIDADLRIVDPDQIAAAYSLDGGKAAKEKHDGIHAKAFSKYMRYGTEGLDPDERNFLAQRFLPNVQNAAQTTTPGTGGGYTIPQGFSDKLEVAMKWFGGIEVCGSFDTETGAPLPYPTVNDTNNVGRIIGQNVQLTNTALTFNFVTFNAYIFSSDTVLIPLSLIQDSYFDMDSFTAGRLGERLGRLKNQQMTIGTGGGTAPTGIVTAAVAAGSIYTAPAGETTSLIYDDLVNLEHTVDPAYRDKGRFMFHDSTLKVLKKLKDTSNRPLWQPGINSSFMKGAEPVILDHPYTINNDMPVMAASAYSILFGDLSKYLVRNVAGGTTVMRLVERYADYLQVGFQAFMRADGNLIDAGTHPVAVFQNSAT